MFGDGFLTGMGGLIVGLLLMVVVNVITWDWAAKRALGVRTLFGASIWFRWAALVGSLAAFYLAAYLLVRTVPGWWGFPLAALIGNVAALGVCQIIGIRMAVRAATSKADRE